jgi:hypothetical protein
LNCSASQILQLLGNGIHPALTFNFGGHNGSNVITINTNDISGFTEILFTPLTNNGNGF